MARPRLETSAAAEQAFLPLLAAHDPITLGMPAGAFAEKFNGQPNTPTQWQPSNWDITVHRRDRVMAFEKPMQAGHGADCSAPPSTHTIQSFSQAVYVCKDHLMTAIYAEDYGMIYFTPDRMVDFSQEEAVIRFDMSTLRTASRDWIDIWVTPYDDNLQIPLNDYFPDANGEPRRSVQIKMDSFSDKTIFKGAIFKDFKATGIDGNWWTGYDEFLTPDAKRRDTFELRISRTHVKFGMPAYNFWWIDTKIADLGWDRGVVQFGHHSYNPLKDCSQPCAANTWHWDNVAIAPSVPFTILRGDRPTVGPTDAITPVRFASPAPEDAHLRFTAISEKIEVSYDGGQTWSEAQLQKQKTYRSDHFRSYWTPIPAGTSEVLFRKNGQDLSLWMVRDVTIWSPTAASDS